MARTKRSAVEATADAEPDQATEESVTRLIRHEEVMTALDLFLKEQKCILYGQAYDVVSEQGRAACAEYLAEVFESLTERPS